MKQSDINQLILAMKSIFATKEDLGSFATKDDLRSFATKEDIQAVDQKISKLDTKQDGMDIKLDAFLGEILTYREEQDLQAEKLKDHTLELESQDSRIKVMEKRHSSNPTPIFSPTA